MPEIVYYGQLEKPKADISFQDATNSITRSLYEVVFLRWPHGFTITRVPDELPPDVFVKRPKLGLYDIFLKHKVVHLLPKGLVEEAEAMEVLKSLPHPNIVGYHGCRVRRGHITRLLLDRHLHDLNDYLKSGNTILK